MQNPAQALPKPTHHIHLFLVKFMFILHSPKRIYRVGVSTVKENKISKEKKLRDFPSTNPKVTKREEITFTCNFNHWNAKINLTRE